MYNPELDCNCTHLEHEKFNSIIKDEINKVIAIEDIVNKSYCISFDFEHYDENANLSAHETLQDLKGKVGVYLLWVNLGHCTEHEMYRMLCLYVGKGFAFQRIKSHIKDKWPNSETLYVTFYECENRIAKYIEQLFLDCYDFYLNKEENNGSGHLETIWNEERYIMGTELHSLSERLADKFPEQFQ
ncbi:hypothetical protein ACQXXB_10120 [Aeromonas veronii]|uniref:hypothetical protein n=1 Tax=Aeromonas veronii TaxID=654 RepID=UPI003D1B25DD|nr:hypothetical protein [Aeromonas veronii]